MLEDLAKMMGQIVLFYRNHRYSDHDIMRMLLEATTQGFQVASEPDAIERLFPTPTNEMELELLALQRDIRGALPGWKVDDEGWELRKGEYSLSVSPTDDVPMRWNWFVEVENEGWDQVAVSIRPLIGCREAQRAAVKAFEQATGKTGGREGR